MIYGKGFHHPLFSGDGHICQECLSVFMRCEIFQLVQLNAQFLKAPPPARLDPPRPLQTAALLATKSNIYIYIRYIYICVVHQQD